MITLSRAICPEIVLDCSVCEAQNHAIDDDFLDLIDRAFLDGQIDGDTMELAYQWLAQKTTDVPRVL